MTESAIVNERARSGSRSVQPELKVEPPLSPDEWRHFRGVPCISHNQLPRSYGKHLEERCVPDSLSSTCQQSPTAHRELLRRREAETVKGKLGGWQALRLDTSIGLHVW